VPTFIFLWAIWTSHQNPLEQLAFPQEPFKRIWELKHKMIGKDLKRIESYLEPNRLYQAPVGTSGLGPVVPMVLCIVAKIQGIE
jgi:hypothetical protein